MNTLKKNWYLGLIALLLLVVIAYSVSSNNDDEKSSPEQTLQAIYLERTQTAQASSVSQGVAGEGEAAFIEPEHQTVPENPSSPEQAKKELNRAKILYRAQGITHYRLKVRHMRSIWHMQTYDIEVWNGEITHTAACVPAPTEGGQCQVEPFDPADYTVEGLFDTVTWVLESDYANWANIQYHTEYGYPKIISFNHPNILDEDNLWAVLEFELLP